MSINL